MQFSDRPWGEDSHVHVCRTERRPSQDVVNEFETCRCRLSGPHNLVNRGCPSFLQLLRDVHKKSVEFSKQVSFSFGLSGGNMKACSHGSHHAQEA